MEAHPDKILWVGLTGGCCCCNSMTYRQSSAANLKSGKGRVVGKTFTTSNRNIGFTADSLIHCCITLYYVRSYTIVILTQVGHSVSLMSLWWFAHSAFNRMHDLTWKNSLKFLVLYPRTPGHNGVTPFCTLPHPSLTHMRCIISSLSTTLKKSWINSPHLSIA